MFFMFKFQIIRLPETITLQCPQCLTVHSRGVVIVQVVFEAEEYVYAELAVCCGDETPQPVLCLFDTDEQAQFIMDRFRTQVKRKEDFFQAPLVRKADVFNNL